jgi:serine/threonine protein phosphatase PrpC
MAMFLEETPTPPLSDSYWVAGAQLIGQSHIDLGRNGQDAWAVLAHDEVIVAAVADGCSGGAWCEVGAQLAVRWMTSQVVRSMSRGAQAGPELLDQLMGDLTDELISLSRKLSPPGAGLFGSAGDLFLFTLLVAIVAPEQTHVVLVGDGVFAINGHVTVIETAEGKSAPYPIYTQLPEIDPSSVDERPPVHVSVPTATLRSLVLATDGLAEVLSGVGPDGAPPLLTRLESDQALRRDPALLQARLEAVAHEGDGLYDDATLVMIEAR